MLLSGVYKIQNTVNGKVYIGSSRNALRRMSEHKRLLRQNKHHSAHLQSAWNIDGESAFTFEVIISCREEDLLYCEQLAINEYKASQREFGYNALKIAGSSRGFRHSEETRLAFSKARAGKRRTEEWIVNMSASRRGKRRDPAAVEKTRLANIGRKLSPQQIESIRKRQTGKKWTEEQRRAFILSSTGRKHSAETLAKLKENAGKKPKILVLVNGEEVNVRTAAKILNIHRDTVYHRIKTGALQEVRSK